MRNNSYIKIIKLDSVSSTNGYARDLARKNTREITVVRANSQTQGKGRMDRYWFSPKNKGIYTSFILTPVNILADIYYLPLVFALAVVRSLKNILPLYIKIPNDVFSKGGKLAGILVEAKVAKQKADFVIVGIGINVNSNKEELPLKATSLYLETGLKYNIEELFACLIKEVILLYREFKCGNIDMLLKEAFRYQETKTLKKLKAAMLKNKESEELVHILP